VHPPSSTSRSGYLADAPLCALPVCYLLVGATTRVVTAAQRKAVKYGRNFAMAFTRKGGTTLGAKCKLLAAAANAILQPTPQTRHLRSPTLWQQEAAFLTKGNIENHLGMERRQRATGDAAARRRRRGRARTREATSV